MFGLLRSLSCGINRFPISIDFSLKCDLKKKDNFTNKSRREVERGCLGYRIVFIDESRNCLWTHNVRKVKDTSWNLLLNGNRLLYRILLYSNKITPDPILQQLHYSSFKTTISIFALRSRDRSFANRGHLEYDEQNDRNAFKLSSDVTTAT